MPKLRCYARLPEIMCLWKLISASRLSTLLNVHFGSRYIFSVEMRCLHMKIPFCTDN